MTLFIGLLLLLLAAFTVALQRAYEHVPVKELRRRARGGDELARGLYRAVAYGYSLRALLIGFSVLSNALLFLYVARTIDAWFSLIVIIALLWFMYAWLPAQAVRGWMERIASFVAPAIAAILQYVHPMIDRAHRFIRRHRPIHIHSGMYETEDIVALLEKQREQNDNRIPDNTIHVAIAALTFSDKLVRDTLTPRRVVHSVSADDSIGPILLAELHESGFSRFPVYEETEDEIVGILLLRDLLDAKKGGKISKYMRKKVCFVHEEQTLRNALDAVIKTHQQLFIVVNSFEEYVGVISIEDILEEVLGEQIVDEFDAYEDMRAVAASQARKDHKKHNHPAGKVALKSEADVTNVS